MFKKKDTLEIPYICFYDDILKIPRKELEEAHRVAKRAGYPLMVKIDILQSVIFFRKEDTSQPKTIKGGRITNVLRHTEKIKEKVQEEWPSK